MPISLNFFQQTLNTSPLGMDSYIRLSKDKSGVESYNAGFFGRHFHLHASRDDNREVRRAFYESITSQYKCSDAFCASLRQELGIDSGNHSALSVRDAQDILQRVKIAAHTLDNKEVIEPGHLFEYQTDSAFQTEIIAKYQSALKKADDASNFPDVKTAFRQAYMDYNRAGTGLKVGNTVIAHVDGQTPESSELRVANNQKMTTELEQFFGVDSTNGLRAARIIGDIVHQGISHEVVTSLLRSNDPALSKFTVKDNIIDGTLLDMGHIMEFSVDRANDGSYNIHYTGTFKPKSIDSYNPDGMLTRFFDSKNSKITYKMDLVLSFDSNDGKPKIDLAQPLQLSGKLTPIVSPDGIDITPFSFGELKDPKDDTTFSQAASALGLLNDEDIQIAIFKTQDIKFLRSKVITDSDIKLLSIFNIDQLEVGRMMSGLGLDDNVPTLGKETINQLLDSNPVERSKGIQKLKDLLTAYDALGWAPPDRQSNTRCDLRPELLNLVTVAELNHSSGNPCDAKLVADYIREMKDDPDVQQILEDLGSGDQDRIDTAKENINWILDILRPKPSSESAPPPPVTPQTDVHQTTTTTDGAELEQPGTPAPPPIAPQPDVHQTTTTTITTDGSEPDQPSTPAPPPPVTPQPDVQSTMDTKPDQPSTSPPPPPVTPQPDEQPIITTNGSNPPPPIGDPQPTDTKPTPSV